MLDRYDSDFGGFWVMRPPDFCDAGLKGRDIIGSVWKW